MKRNRNVWKGLVAVEGIDGAGTTTLTRELKDALSSKNIPFTAGFEPTDGVIGKIIRTALSGKEDLCPETLALLFSADRREHLYGKNGIQEALKAGQVYITDRYWFSSLAYQTLDSDWDWVDYLNAPYPLPGHLIFAGIPVDEAQKRLSRRDGQDIFDEAALQYRVVEAYEKAIGAYEDSGMKVLRLDSTKTPHELCRQSVDFLSDLF